MTETKKSVECIRCQKYHTCTDLDKQKAEAQGCDSFILNKESYWNRGWV